MSQFAKGMRVRIIMPMMPDVPTEGEIYYHMPASRWPWHVRPKGWNPKKPGIAFGENDIEPLSESEQEVQRA